MSPRAPRRRRPSDADDPSAATWAVLPGPMVVCSNQRHRLAEIGKVDFFGAPGREIAEGLVSGLEERMKPTTGESSRSTRSPRASRSSASAPG